MGIKSWVIELQMTVMCSSLKKATKKFVIDYLFLIWNVGLQHFSVQAFLAVKAEAKGKIQNTWGLEPAAVSLLHAQMLPGSGTVIQTSLHFR